MSYCRFSSDNFQSDVYVYESCYGGWDVHVAANHIVTELPEVPGMFEVEPGEWIKAHNAQMAALDTAEREPIGGEYDGDSHNFSTLDELLQFLVVLSESGYHVPGYVIKCIKEEMKELQHERESQTDN